MDNVHYHEKNVEKFIYEKLCQREHVLWENYKKGNVATFRKELQKLDNVDINLRYVVYSMCLSAMRNEIYDLLSKLSATIKPFGDVVVVGDEAINHFLARRQRLVSTSFRLKMVPSFFVSSIGTVFNGHPLYHGYLQGMKVLLWYLLGKAAQKFSYSVTRTMKPTLRSGIAKVLGLKLKNVNAVVVRKYNRRANGNEFMSLCLKVRYFHTKYNSIGDDLIHLMDFQIIKTPSTSYDHVHNRQRGVTFYDSQDGKLNYYPHVMIASKRYLVDGEQINLSKNKLVLFARSCCNAQVTTTMGEEEIVAVIRDACIPLPPVVSSRPISNAVWNDVKALDVTTMDRFTFRGELSKFSKPPHIWVDEQILKNVEAIPNACN